jgi:hypothetical protein
MTRDLNLSSSDLEWVTDAYTILYAALMLVLGVIGDKRRDHPRRGNHRRRAPPAPPPRRRRHRHSG